MANLYPTSQELGLKPIKSAPKPARPAAPARPVKPSHGAEHKVQMKTPWDRTVTVKASDATGKLQQGYKYVKNVVEPPNSTPRKAAQEPKGPKGAHSATKVTEMLTFREIINEVVKKQLRKSKKESVCSHES